jgi:hypothetical protein
MLIDRDLSRLHRPTEYIPLKEIRISEICRPAPNFQKSRSKIGHFVCPLEFICCAHDFGEYPFTAAFVPSPPFGNPAWCSNTGSSNGFSIECPFFARDFRFELNIVYKDPDYPGTTVYIKKRRRRNWGRGLL